MSLSSQKYGFGIRDPRSGLRYPEKPIPDPGVNKAPDGGSKSATLLERKPGTPSTLCYMVALEIQNIEIGTTQKQLGCFFVRQRKRDIIQCRGTKTKQGWIRERGEVGRGGRFKFFPLPPTYSTAHLASLHLPKIVSHNQTFQYK